MLIYSITKGTLTSDTRGLLWKGGYAGNGKWKNDVASCNVKGHGPIPIGLYRMTGVRSGGTTGPYSIVLLPDKNNVMFGRGDFLLHGDSISHPGEASDGCIIKSPRSEREKAYAEPDKLLRVVE